MHKVDGNALIYSLFIVLVIGSIVTLVLMIAQHSSQNVIRFQQGIQDHNNLKSGIALLLSKDDFQPLNSTQELSLFEGPQHKIITKRMLWGLYEIIGVTTANLSSKYGIIGSANINTTALYLADNNQPLKVAGKTQLEGTCYLPQKGIERGNVTGHPYSGSRLVYGNKLQSKKVLPPLNKVLLQHLEEKETALDSIKLWDDYIDSLTQSFNQKTLHLISSSPIVLTHQKINGNIILESSEAIHVSNTAKLGNLVLKAPFITIADDFSGTLQLQARDSIVIGKHVLLNYPSSLVLYDTKPVKAPSSYIKIGANTSIFGELLAYQKQYNYRDKISIQSDVQSSITGNIYINGIANLKATTIYGTLYCQQVNVKTGGSIQNNTLLDILLSSKKRSEYYLGANLLEAQQTQKKGIINWLE
ncbi:MAG: hypothetical protein N4A35_06940 [Flavobacteriales bacterium]|jgi:hypothetical protein|nr:hypothetical protein [Flavobacteriales bacterium]